jgi:hypothetical protein
MNRVDREALKRALALLRADPEYSAQILSKLAAEPWEDVAEFAAFCAQSDSLGLQPWQSAPMYAGLSPHQPDALALMVRLVGAGLSRFEPDPIAALAQARSASPVVPKG